MLDVREYPLSRKKGFSNNAFAQCLAAEGIAYEHSRALGCPKPIRKQYKEDGDWAAYACGFRAYIRTQGTVLKALVCSTADQRICMVCYEADAAFCHRSLIAEAAQGWTVRCKPSIYLSEQSHLLIACCRSPRRINQADNQPLSRKTMEGAH